MGILLTSCYSATMDVAQFKDSPIGDLVAISGQHRGKQFQHFAYVPDPLPDDIVLAGRTWQILSDAALELGRLDGSGNQLPNPHLLARPAIRREAVSTSALEGTYTTLPQVLQSELLEGDEKPSREVDEVLAYVRAAEAGFDWIQERPLSLNMIKSLQEILMRDDPDCPDHETGEFRNRQNFIGPRNARVEDSFFVPPPAGDTLMNRLYQWEEWIHKEDIPLLVRVAVGHYQFETLHPFIDGNGRIGRLIAVLMLLEEGILSVPLINISPYLEDHRDEYQSHLRAVSAVGTYDPWIQFFLTGLKEMCLEARDKTERLVALREEMVALLRSQRIRGTSIQIAEDSIGEPIVTPTRVGKRYGISYQAASYAIGRLVEAGLFEELHLQGNRRMFFAPKVLEILN